jgi:hypothetical protein
VNADVLDRLLMDRALGVLAPDVETLLGAYLEREPDAARRVAEYADATGLAGRLLKVGGAKPLPPFPEAKLREAEVARRRRRIVRQVASLAACVLVGVWAGAWWGGTAGVEPAPGPRTTNPVVVDAGSSGDDAGFWSLERLSETVQQKKRTRPVLFKWDSPMRKPTMGETT